MQEEYLTYARPGDWDLCLSASAQMVMECTGSWAWNSALTMAAKRLDIGTILIKHNTARTKMWIIDFPRRHRSMSSWGYQ